MGFKYGRVGAGNGCQEGYRQGVWLKRRRVGLGWEGNEREGAEWGRGWARDGGGEGGSGGMGLEGKGCMWMGVWRGLGRGGEQLVGQVKVKKTKDIKWFVETHTQTHVRTHTHTHTHTHVPLHPTPCFIIHYF